MSDSENTHSTGQKDTRLNPQESIEFRSIVAKARQRVGLSQPDLASMAGVALRTVVKIEEKGVARWDAIARIAQALNEPVEEWIRLAGHIVPRSRVEDLLRPRPAPMILPFPRLDPEEYYKRVVARLKVHCAALTCTCILSPVPLANEALKKQIESVLKHGLHYALLCPFPLVDPDFASRRPRLAHYYANTYLWTCNLADRLRKMVPHAKNRVHVFTPVIPTGCTPLVHTPLRANELRPSFTKYPETEKASTLYEFGAYIRFADRRPDEWIDVYCGQGDMNDRVREAYEPWYDYCFDVVNAWTPTNEGSKYDTSKLGGWKLTAA